MVDFQPSEDQQLIRDTVRQFAVEQIRPQARPTDESGPVSYTHLTLPTKA